MKKMLFFNTMLLIALSAHVLQASLRTIEDEKEFNDIIQSKTPSVIVFSASWCPACRELQGPLQAVVDNPEFKNIVFAKVDTDANQALTRKYSLREKGIPTIMFMQSGKQKYEIVGAETETTLSSAIRTTFGTKEAGTITEETTPVQTASTQKEESSSTGFFQAFINVFLSILNYIKEMISVLFCNIKCALKDMFSSRK